MREQWSEISENLKKMLHSGVFKVWIAPLQAKVHAGGLLLTAPNAFVASWLEGKMLTTLREAAAPVLGLQPEQVDVRITAATEACASAGASAPRHQADQRMTQPGMSQGMRQPGAANQPATTCGGQSQPDASMPFAPSAAVVSAVLPASAAMPSLSSQATAAASQSAQPRLTLQGTLPMLSTVPQVFSYLVSGDLDAAFVNEAIVRKQGNSVGGWIEVNKGYKPLLLVAGVVEGRQKDPDVVAYMEGNAPASPSIMRTGQTLAQMPSLRHSVVSTIKGSICTPARKARG